MRRLFFLFFLIVVLSTCKKETPKVLLFIKEGSPELGYMLIYEVGKMSEILKQSGFNVKIATVSGDILKTDSVSLTPDIKLNDAKVDDYAGFIFPCMASNTIQPEAVAFVKKIANEGKPIAAQLGGILFLGEAGVLKGKKFAFKDEKDANPGMFPMFNDAIFSGRGVIKDGNIITSGTCPMMAKAFGYKDGTAELTLALIDAIKGKNK
jgi:putative intracellular protease/amidase